MANPKHEDEVIKPAVEGTLSVCRACKANNVKRLVITASLLTSTEEKKPSVYSKSKKLANKASWDYWNALPANEKFEMVSIHPALIIGPNNNTAQFTSGDIIKNIMTKEWSKLPRISMGTVDVRDVADAHVLALKVPEANGKSFQLCENAYWMTQIGENLHKMYKNQGYDPAFQQVPKCLLGCASIFDGEAKTMYDMWGVEMNFDNSSTKSILGINFKDH